MAATHRRQINVEVPPRLLLVAQTLALITGESVPQLLRPVIEQYLEDQIGQNTDLANAVASIESGQSRRIKTAPVVRLPGRAEQTAED